jgi:hypothetical protein
MSIWIFHDSYKTQEDAREEGESIVKLGLAKGVKVVKEGKKARPFLLYIVPIKEKGEK